MHVIKARMARHVRNDSEMHSTGITGLHSPLRRSCNPVTHSRVFHCHFAHTRAFVIEHTCKNFSWISSHRVFMMIGQHWLWQWLGNELKFVTIHYLHRLVQERCNSSALAMELHLSCTNPSMWKNNTHVHRRYLVNLCKNVCPFMVCAMHGK